MPTNTITIVGNLTRDPELRFTPSGQATVNFGVAVNRRWQNKQTQEWEEAVSFFDVTAWRNLAENLAQSVTKGDRVIVTGRLEQRSWETAEKERRYKIEIVADEVAAAMSYATVEVHRVQRSGAPGANDPNDYGQRSNSSRPSATPAGPPASDYYDEEPF
jgi:single-strand DNA-binding protein